jgi:hypothetical protein
MEEIQEIMSLFSKICNQNGKCSMHDADLTLFCEDCVGAICIQCVLCDCHPKHKFIKLDEAVANEIVLIKSQNEDLDAKIAQLEVLKEKLMTTSNDAEVQHTEQLVNLKKERDQEVEEAIRAIDEKFDAMRSDLEKANEFNMIRLNKERNTLNEKLEKLAEMKESNQLLQNIKFEITESRNTIRQQLDFLSTLEIPKKIDVTIFDR